MTTREKPAAAHWRDRVESHHVQSEAVQDASALDDDFWRPFASHFRLDPRRTDDPVLERLVRYIGPDQTVLDVGGGAGRFALPMALRCCRVTLVDPSEGMLDEARAGAGEAGIDNLTVVTGTWEEARVEPADVVLCSHVLYGVAEVVPFIRKLEAHAIERVVVLKFINPPQSRLSPFWKAVHDEERIEMPALPELLSVLWEMGIYPDVEMLEPREAHGYSGREEALDQLRRRLYVVPGTPEDDSLQTSIAELMVETPDGLEIKAALPGRQGVVSWWTR